MGNSEAEDIKQRDLKQNYKYSIKHTKEVIRMAKDPVCGMEVDEKAAAATSEYKGKVYYFCALGCKKDFDADPEKYSTGPGTH